MPLSAFFRLTVPLLGFSVYLAVSGSPAFLAAIDLASVTAGTQMKNRAAAVTVYP
jgi:hypothetical protein